MLLKLDEYANLYLGWCQKITVSIACPDDFFDVRIHKGRYTNRIPPAWQFHNQLLN
uniref:Uncharacterized protein n=1 Tax=Arundo donax TaxID=35708 RepID=A0A0A9G0J8_ARUDO